MDSKQQAVVIIKKDQAHKLFSNTPEINKKHSLNIQNQLITSKYELTRWRSKANEQQD